MAMQSCNQGTSQLPRFSENIICVSGDYKSGKSNFSSRLAAALNIEHFSMRTLKSKHDVYVDWDIVLRKEENQEIDREIVEIARRGRCLLDFRYSALLCAIEAIAYTGIWITASLDVRIEGNAYFWKKSRSETETIIRKREKEELRDCMELYGRSYRDPSLYHMSIDTSSYWLPVTVPMDTTPLVSKCVTMIRAQSEKN